MPIIVKDFSWRQTDEVLIIRAPLKGANVKNVNFITADDYIKASYPPYIFELFLTKSIKESESTCIKSDNELIFNLVKEEKCHWDVLEKELTKAEKKEFRENIHKSNEIKYKQIAKEKSEKKAELNRVAVRHQIKMDETTRKKIEEIKNNERQKMAKEITEWKENSASKKQVALSGARSESNTSGKDGEISSKMSATQRKRESKKQNNSVVQIPVPRAPSSITISFTPRAFPTPSRESKSEEENEWLRKQAEARRISGLDDKDLSLEEKDPMWLKEKGDSFFRVGNYQGAIAAYTHGIKLSEGMSALYSNRAAAQIALGNFHKALEDSSTALELINPKTPSNATARARCHAKRGAAFWKLGLLDQGLVEFCAARDLIKYHDKESDYLKTLQEDIQKLSSQLDGKSESGESDSEVN